MVQCADAEPTAKGVRAMHPLSEPVAHRATSFIAAVTDWEGFASSVATKVPHKKRPKLIPILDDEAIFGAYMNPKWPESWHQPTAFTRRHVSRETTPTAHPRVPQATHPLTSPKIGADP